ncbi:MAG: ribbon-helix-helix protein, CopG family [Vicinamibacterales bacterium]
MALTVRLGSRAERALNAAARRRGVTRSDIVREALEQYGTGEAAGQPDRPYDAWVDVIGVVDLGVRDPARTTGEQFAALLRRSSTRRAR